MKFNKILRIGLLILAALLLLIQFIPVDIKSVEGAPANEIIVPDNVKSILETSCYDCHSNQIVRPWYSHIAPISFLIAHHVNEGREELNFSEWSTYTKKRQKNKLESTVEQIEEDEMPLFSYIITHPGAALSPEQKTLLITWADTAYDVLDSD